MMGTVGQACQAILACQGNDSRDVAHLHVSSCSSYKTILSPSDAAMLAGYSTQFLLGSRIADATHCIQRSKLVLELVF